MHEQSIFIEALEIEGSVERAAFLDRACAADPALRERIERLLARHELNRNKPSSPFAAGTTADAITERAGAVIASYKLLEQIGEGGFGVVFLAEQIAPVRRKVALKVLKPGMDTKQVVARFEAERQALAIMDHPNIAKVLDGGATETRRPYFVMELVKGVPITDFCDQNCLTPHQRMELFVQVCGAVQHAHQKGIIHRDIKPSNVLVSRHDTTPVVKVIDFGIAKALGQELTDKTLFTGVAQMIGTPLYMSPEQAGMSDLDVDTRSDIYSLGVLLYELLTGTTPLDKKRLKGVGHDEIRRIIREEEPPRPSTRLSTVAELVTIATNRGVEPRRLSGQVRGELDWIVMKALEKDRNRRYESANGFAADVQRYLADEPVQACPPSVGYRFRKFARRNRRTLWTAAVVAVAILLAIGGGGWAAWEQSTRRATIAARANQVLDESQVLYQQRKLPEATQQARNALALAEGGGEDSEATRRAREWLKDLEMVARLEEIHPRGDGDWAMKLDEYPKAFQEYGIDLEALTPEESAARIAVRPIRVDLAVALDRWVVYVFNWGFSKGLEGEKGVAFRARLRQIARLSDPDSLRNRLRNAYAKADNPQDAGEDLEAIATSVDLTTTPIATLMVIADGLNWPESGSFYKRVQQQYPNDFGVTFTLGRSLGIYGDQNGAIRFLTAAVALRPESRFARWSLANALLAGGRVDEAIAEYRQVNRHSPVWPRIHVDVGGALLRLPGRDQEAASEFREALRLAPDPAAVHEAIGEACAASSRIDQAIEAFREAIRLKPDLVLAHRQLGLALEKKGLLDDAIAAHREALRVSQNHGICLNDLGQALVNKGHFEEGIAILREAVRSAPKNSNFHNHLGLALSEAKHHDEAIAEFREAVRLKPADAILHANLGIAHEGKGELDAAFKELQEAIRLDPGYALAHDHLGTYFENKGLLDDAIKSYREAVRLKPESIDFRLRLGRALRNRGLLIDAIVVQGEAVRLAPHDATAHHWLGTTLEKKGLLDDAIAAHREAVRLQPGDATKRAWLGGALLKKGLVDDAIEAFRESIRLKGNVAAVHSALAGALEKKGLLDDAIKSYREAVHLNPDDSNYQHRLGSAHARLGQWGPAATAFSRALELGPNNCFSWYRGLPLHLAAGDAESYKRLCQKMLERFGQTNDLITAEWTAKTCALIPNAVADFKPVEKLADRIVTGTEKHPSYRFFVLVKAIVEYRAGRHEEAVRWAERFGAGVGGNEFDAFVFATLSMAHHRLGNADKARAALASAEMIVTSKMPDPAKGRPFQTWHEWLHADVVLRESQALAKEK